MHSDQAPSEAHSDIESPWFRDGSVPHSREDRIAEALALVALLFSLGIGLVIALLPASASAATSAAPSGQVAEPVAPTLVLSAFKGVAAQPGKPERLVGSEQARATSSNTRRRIAIPTPSRCRT